MTAFIAVFFDKMINRQILMCLSGGWIVTSPTEGWSPRLLRGSCLGDGRMVALVMEGWRRWLRYQYEGRNVGG